MKSSESSTEAEGISDVSNHDVVDHRGEVDDGVQLEQTRLSRVFAWKLWQLGPRQRQSV